MHHDAHVVRKNGKLENKGVCRRRKLNNAINAHSGMQSGRGERIRTSGLYVPNVALYQAKLHPASRGVLSCYKANLALLLCSPYSYTTARFNHNLDFLATLMPAVRLLSMK
jgi:hypothetical protein